MDYFCILGGGGIRGVAYVGALRALLEQNVNITGYAGSSIGAVFTSLLAVGYSLDEIEHLFMNLKMDIFKDINFDFHKGFALSRGEKFLLWIRDLIESKYYGEKYVKNEMPPVKFSDLDMHLIILSINLTDSSFKEFSRTITPDAEIALAVRASVSMPGLYTPVFQGSDIIVDGDLIKSWPLWRVSPNLRPSGSRILEFRLEDVQTDKKINNGLDYLNAVYNTISGFATDFIIDLYSERDKFDYIKINSTDVRVLDFLLSNAKKQELIRVGYETTMEYFKETLPKKRKKLFENYYSIQLALTRLKHELEVKNNVKSAYCVLAEIFMHLCEHKRYIDIDIYDVIVAFKDLFSRNYHISSFLFISGYKLNDKSLVVREVEEIIKMVSKKTLELKT
ncbi:putative esterase of the alpha-beta hydrolase superfamily [Candidatus Gastranaerophilus sp. (ex Termes propinquus)]|nr:putative esterase of the alpha-beta hydrolase superfamily [Candidatus Gastranaerophilus sp. (ex Termes propinquus)]